jgi:hypothetical protein
MRRLLPSRRANCTAIPLPVHAAADIARDDRVPGIASGETVEDVMRRAAFAKTI